jgi:hypothetical protein
MARALALVVSSGSASKLDLTLLRFRLCPDRGSVKHNDVTSVDEFLDRTGDVVV